jgi:hypothetical protein
MTAPTIDLMPLISEALWLLVPPVFAWAVALIARRLRLSGEALQAERLDRVCELAIQYAISRLEDADWTRLSTRNAIVADAGNYVVRAIPQILAAFRIDRQGVEDRVAARLHAYDPKPGIWRREFDDGAVDAAEAVRRAARGQGFAEADA